MSRRKSATKVPKGFSSPNQRCFFFADEELAGRCCHTIAVATKLPEEKEDNDDEVACVNKAAIGSNLAALLTITPSSTVVTIPGHDGFVLWLRHLTPGGG